MNRWFEKKARPPEIWESALHFDNDFCPAWTEASVSVPWADSQAFTFRNLRIGLATGNEETVTIEIHNSANEVVDTITLDRFHDPCAPALILDRLASLPCLPNATPVEPELLGTILRDAMRLGARIRSGLGRRIAEIEENYEHSLRTPEKRSPPRYFELDPVSRTFNHVDESALKGMGAGQVEKKPGDSGPAPLGKVYWLDFDVSIIDSAAQRDRMDILLKENISWTDCLAEDPLFFDSRLFVQDEEDPCKINRQKFCCYIGSNWVVTIHDGPFEPLDKVASSLKNGARQSITTPEALYLGILHRCQDHNEDTVKEMENIITSLHGELIENGNLSPKTLQHEMVPLAKSLSYITRKLEDYNPICSSLRARMEEQGDEGLRGLRARLQDEEHRIESLTRKAEALNTLLNELIGLNTSISSTKAAEKQKEVGVIATIAVPLALATSIAGIASQLGPPQLSFILGGIVLSAGLAVMGYRRKWFGS